MPAHPHELEPESSMLRRIGLVAGTILASIALVGAMPSAAFADEQVGFFLTGEESEEEVEQPRFEVAEENYPADLIGYSTSSDFVYEFEPGTLTCPGWYSGEASSAESELILNPTYEFWACESPLGSPLTLSQNGCQHTVTVLNEGPPYVGEFGVECPTEAEYTFEGSNCDVMIPSQSAVSELGFSNVGEGSEQAVKVDIDVSGLEYNLDSPWAPLGYCTGNHQDGTLTATVTLKASVSE